MTAAIPLLRTNPRLWVERLWILDALDVAKPLREITFSQGLNLVVSVPGDGNTGHGVGKTALCQLLRCVLEDPQWATGTPLRDELLHSFPDGAVAARVHVDGEPWTVLKPWQHQMRYRASRNGDWQALARDEVPNDHDAYVAALNEKLVGSLPVKKLPGSGQKILWQHILAWCSRDQECRYRSYYHWRTEGAGFSLPSQSPAVLVKVVLGLLDDASLDDSLKQIEARIAKLETSVADLKRRPGDLLQHVRHQLAVALNQPEKSPFRAAGLLNQTSLKGMAQQRQEAYSAELANWEVDRSRAEDEREQAAAERAPFEAQLRAVENRVKQLEAAIADDLKELQRLQTESAALQGRLQIRCEDGDRLVGNCEYAAKRVASISLNSVRNTKLREELVGQWQHELTGLRQIAAQLEQRLRPLWKRHQALKTALAAGQLHEIDILAARQRLQDALADYELYEGIVEGRSEWHELKAVDDDLHQQKRKRDNLLLEMGRRRGRFLNRRSAIEATLASLVEDLPGFDWGVLREDEPRPFHLGPAHSTALAVLETLIGDIVCLIDSKNPQSFHPGFLLHDSPREAELSEPMFWKFLEAVAEHQEAVQYIVTTSTGVPVEYRRYLRLELGNNNDGAMLFHTRLGVEQQTLGARL